MAKVKKKVAIKKKPVKAKEASKRVLVASKAKVAAKPKAAKVTKEIIKKKSDKNNGAEAVKSSKPSKPAPPPKPPTAEMLQIRSRLMTMLAQVRNDIDHEVRGASERDLAHINDTSDMASDAAEGDLALRIAESETAEAGEIERAIEKIDNGTYGTCEMCNKAINAERLQFLPYVTMCIKCQELAEIRKRESGDELDDLAEGSDSDSES
ncbi:MAG TPA: TraR/DksA family transcriptional regulator [Planctomycetota bacterium]|nr:TraR/DksA family transcriptional regulator [Planctomycetota bacterium]